MPDFAVRTAFTATDKISPAFKRMGASADSFASRAKAVFAGIIGADIFGTITSGIKNFVTAGIETASNLQEVQNVVDTTFGNSASAINDFAKTALDRFGLTELQAKKFSGTLGALAKSSGISGDKLVEMSTGLAGIAGDFASFYNLPIEEAFDKIKSGISGETEPLKALGINMSVANMEAFALSQGMTKLWKNMSQAEQTQLRYNYILKASKDAQGDFAKTLDTSYANQKRVFEGMRDQAMGEIMSKLLPMLTDMFKKLNEGIKNLDTDRIASGLKTFADIVVYLAGWLPELIGGFIAYKAALIGVAVWQGILAASSWIKYLSEMSPVIMQSVKAQGLYKFLLGETVIAQKLSSVWSGILAAKTNVLTAATWLFNDAAAANPIGAIVVAVTALVAGIVALIYYLDELTGRFKEKTEPFKNASIESQQLAEAQAMMGFTPTQALTAVGTKGLETVSNPAPTAKGMEAPNLTEIQARQINLQGEINISGAPQGTTVRSVTKGAQPIQMNLVGKNT